MLEIGKASPPTKSFSDQRGWISGSRFGWCCSTFPISLYESISSIFWSTWMRKHWSRHIYQLVSSTFLKHLACIKGKQKFTKKSCHQHPNKNINDCYMVGFSWWFRLFVHFQSWKVRKWGSHGAPWNLWLPRIPLGFNPWFREVETATRRKL